MNIKHIWLVLIFIGFSACNDIEDVSREESELLPELTSGTANFSTFVAVGASFSAGFTDNALFIKGQENSFPNIMAMEFLKINGGDFKQPLMNDNIGGFLDGGVQSTSLLPRLFFNGSGPALLSATSTTNITTVLSDGPYKNIGIPGAKSYHLTLPGTLYAALNPYYGRMNPGANTMVQYAIAQQPTFFSLSEIGGNDVLSYATGGGVGLNQTGNFNPATYGPSDITDPTVFRQIFTGVVNDLTINGAKGVVGTVPYITRLPYFTTVPYNPLSPAAIGGAANINLLNTQLYGPLNGIFTAYGEPERIKLLSATAANPLLIHDEDAADRSNEITTALTSTLGAQTAAAFGAIFGKARQATETDLLVLTLSNEIGKVVSSAPAPINLNGITYPLADKWVLIPSEQLAVKTAVDAYNITIANVATAKGLAIVDFSAILEQAATTGISANGFTLKTDLVTGGLVSLDGIHLTSRGYALMANKFLEAIDIKYGSNFVESGNVANIGNYPTNYSDALR